MTISATSLLPFSRLAGASFGSCVHPMLADRALLQERGREFNDRLSALEGLRQSAVNVKTMSSAVTAFKLNARD